jgi:hypothetical protein
MMKSLGSVEEGFGRHATTQNAETAKLRCAIDDGNLGVEVVSRSGGSVPGAAASDH